MRTCTFCNTGLTLSAFVLMGLATTVPAYSAPLYFITDLGTLPSDTSSYAVSINNFGQVVGGSGTNRAFFYNSVKLSEIKPLPGDNEIAVTDINNLGQVVGNSVNTKKLTGNNALLYNSGGTTLKLAGLNDSIPYAINDSGQVVGGAHDLGPFLSSGGRAISLGSLGRVAYDINNKGEVVGITENLTAFLYKNGTTIDLGTLPGDNHSSANSINDKSQVVGYSGPTGIDDGRAFLYSSSTGMINLGRLLPTDKYSVATGINNCGQVVGFSGSNYDFYSTSGLRAFLYSNGKMQDLNKLIPPSSGFTLTAASAINERGQIVGRGSIKGKLHAFLLTPRFNKKQCKAIVNEF